MTFKEFRETAHGIYDWMIFVISDTDSHWKYGYNETLDSKYDDLRVVSFEIKAATVHHITCVVDLI